MAYESLSKPGCLSWCACVFTGPTHQCLMVRLHAVPQAANIVEALVRPASDRRGLGVLVKRRVATRSNARQQISHVLGMP